MFSLRRYGIIEIEYIVGIDLQELSLVSLIWVFLLNELRSYEDELLGVESFQPLNLPSLAAWS